MPPHGRPPSKEPKIHNMRIRLSDKDIEMLEYCCSRTGRTKADIIRAGIRNTYEKLKSEGS